MNNQVKTVYYTGAWIIMLNQVSKMSHIVSYIDISAICAIVITLLFSIRFWVLDNKGQRKSGYWLFISFILVLEGILGLDRVLSAEYYNIVIIAAFAVSTCVNFLLNSQSVRMKMDENEHVMKNTCALLTLVCLMELARYMFTIIL